MITQIQKWKCTLRSISPLRIGDDEEEIVVDQFRQPFIPGTSIAGACRAYLQSIASSDEELDEINELFGTQASQARDTKLIFSDGRSQGEYTIEERTGIRIDGATKTAEDGGLFTRHLVAPGALFEVTITLETTKEKYEKYAKKIEKMLQAIHSGLIRFGAYKSVGSGRLAIESCQTVHYDCSNEKDLMAYVNDDKPYKKLEILEEVEKKGFVQITIKGGTKTPLLIGGVYPNDSSKPDETFMRTADGKPLIPGSSLKGVLRHRVNRIANVLGLPEKDKYIAYLFGSDDPESDLGTGTLRLEDIVLNEEKTKIYPRIAINPLTGGTKDGALLNEETVVGTFETTLYLQLKKEDADISLALLLFALRDLAIGKVSLGSGAAIGRGFLQIEKITMKEDDKEVVFNFISKEATGNTSWLQRLQEALESA